MIAFVLSGGGSLGAVHAGMLQALYERDIKPDLIIGTSVGSVNGAYIASRPQNPDTARKLGDVWRGLRRSHVFPIDPIVGFLGFIGRRTHLVPSRGLRRVIQREIQFADLADAPIPLHVVATDASTGEEISLSTGKTVDAVMASAAIPGIFPPVEWDGRLLIDGAISNFAPISHAVAFGADTVYVLTSGTACGLDRPPRGAIPMLMQSMNFLVTTRLVVEVDHLQDRIELIVLPPPCPLRVAPHDFGKAEVLIKRSYETADTFLRNLAPGAIPSMPMHLMRLGPHAQPQP